MTEPVLLTELRGSTAVLTLNRPQQANALNGPLFRELRGELERLSSDARVRAVVLAGAGEKAFCAGIDLKERSDKSREEVLADREQVVRPLYLALGDHPKPVIAALNGPALGGGAELAITCDLRVASPAATFGQTEIRWGMIPSCGACQRLRLIAGMGVAKDLILTGRVLEAEEAYRLGIYNRLVEPAALLEEALALAEQIGKHSPVAVRQAKKAMEGGAGLPAALDLDFELSMECFSRGEALAKPKEHEAAKERNRS